MILTVTLNPSVDISYKIDEFKINDVNRCENPIKTPGGKGLNVARVLKQLGENVNATGFLGGYVGEFLKEKLNELNIETNFYKTIGNTRNCIAILHGGNQTEILESGEEVTLDEQNGFMEYFKNLVDNSSLVTLSGSMPKGLEVDYYEKLLQIADEKGVRIILDTSGDSLKNIVLNSKVKPYCIKPNETEINQIENKDIQSREELVEYLKSDVFIGIKLIVITMGGKGALIKFKENFYDVTIPKVELVNPVGSGDSTVAGLAYAINSNLDIESTIKYAMACGVLNAMEEKTGYINVDKLEEVVNQVEVKRI